MHFVRAVFSGRAVRFARIWNTSHHFCRRQKHRYAVGEYDEMLTPYLWIDTDKKEFQFGAGSIVSFAAYGTYKVENGIVVAISQITTFRFEIKDSRTLVLIDNGDNEYFTMPVNAQFVHNGGH